jgi:hypothetical protein
MSNIIEWHRIDTEDDLPPVGSYVLITRQDVRDDGSLFRVVCSVSLREAEPGSEYKEERVKHWRRPGPVPGFMSWPWNERRSPKRWPFLRVIAWAEVADLAYQGEP